MQIPLLDVRKLISAGAGDAALVYLYLRSGGTLSQAGSALQLSAAKLEQAAASLRQLGLLQKPDRRLPQEHTPIYTEEDVSRHMERDKRFSQLVGEIQRELGLLDRVMENGWKSLTAKETGRVGGILARRRKAIRSEGEAAKTEAKETAEAKYEN